MANKNSYIYFFIFLFISIAIIIGVYIQINTTILNADTNLAARNIETPAKLILNGYLGTFFGFKFLGNINWLFIPLSILYFIVVKPKIQSNHKAFVLFLLLAFGLIAAKGYFNPRYQLTLLPLFIFFVFYFSWSIFEKLNIKFLKIATASVLLIFIFSNFSLQVFGSQFQEKLNNFLNKEIQSSQKETPNILNINDSTVFVDDVLVFIEEMNTNDYFLINNLPDFYYSTSKKGHYYWCGDDFLYLSSGRETLFTGKTITEIQEYFSEQLNCRYIYTYPYYFNYNKDFDDFIKNHCKLVVRDNEKLLYEIISNEKP